MHFLSKEVCCTTRSPIMRNKNDKLQFSYSTNFFWREKNCLHSLHKHHNGWNFQGLLKYNKRKRFFCLPFLKETFQQVEMLRIMSSFFSFFLSALKGNNCGYSVFPLLLCCALLASLRSTPKSSTMHTRHVRTFFVKKK